MGALALLTCLVDELSRCTGQDRETLLGHIRSLIDMGYAAQ
ncbi:MAG: hypothetical protein ACR2KL_08755 [Nocardioidaceae bacterium]